MSDTQGITDPTYGTRAEHLAWCKIRALEYLENVGPIEAFASMTSDMNKHPETRRHLGLELGRRLLIGGFLSTPAQVREWVGGFL